MAAGAYATTKLLTRQALDDLTERGDQLRDRIASTFQTSNAPFRVSIGRIGNGPGSTKMLTLILHPSYRSQGLGV